MGWIILFLILVLIVTSTINFICCKIDMKKIHNNYGQFIEVNGEKICIDISGNGDKLVVPLLRHQCWKWLHWLKD